MTDATQTHTQNAHAHGTLLVGCPGRVGRALLGVHAGTGTQATDNFASKVGTHGRLGYDDVEVELLEACLELPVRNVIGK